MNIWFVSIFENTPIDDNPNTRFNSLVREAHKRGHTVTFWASTFKHNVKTQRFNSAKQLEIEEGLTLRFVKTKSYKNNISFKRLYSHRDFGEEIINQFSRIGRKPDLVMVAFPPIASAKKISVWCSEHNIPCIVDIIDPWPDVFKSYFTFIPRRLANFVLMPLRNDVAKVMQKVSAVTAISNQYIKWAKGYNPSLSKTNCFYPAVQFDQMQLQLKKAAEKVHKNSDRFNIIYAGSLGNFYDISTILKAAEVLEKEYPNIHFTIAGDGPQKEKVEAYQNNHTNLEYVGRVSKEKLMEYYYRSDMGMTQHVEGATQSVTYKLFDLLACGLPILNSLESEMKDIIIDNEVGMHNDPGDAKKLSENIIYCYENPEKFATMKDNAFSLTKKLGDSKKVYSEAIDFIESFQLSN